MMEIRCPKCGFVMPDDSSFCGRCGCDLTKLFCMQCGKPLVPDSKFCMYCGASVNGESQENLSREAEIESVKETKSVKAATEIAEVKPSKEEGAEVPLQNIEEPNNSFESETATIPAAEVISEKEHEAEKQESMAATEVWQQEDFTEKEPARLEDVIGKNADYYIGEFRKIDAGEKPKFNWAAFLLTYVFCFYRKCGDIAKKYFLIPLVLFGACCVTLGIGTALLNIPVLVIAVILSIVFEIWYFVNAIRLGKNFNGEYQLHLQQVMQSENQNKYGVSMKAGILSVVIPMVVTAIFSVVSSTASIFKITSEELPMETNMIEETENANNSETYADNLSYYVGTWYGSNLKEEAELPETKVVGMQLTILPLDGRYYAYLATNTDVETYTFDKRTYEGDSLIPIFLTEEGKWIAYFDEYDEAGNYVDSGSLVFWKSATGELFGECYSATGEDIGQTKFVQDSKWLNGQYSNFEEENSYLSKNGADYPLYAIDCEVVLRAFVYGKWHDSTGIESESITLLPGQIYVSSITKNASDGITKIQYSTMRDPMKMHTIRVPEEFGVIYIDGRYYSGGYSDLIEEEAGFEVSTYLLPTDSCYITFSDLAPFSKEEVALIRNEIYARYGCTFNNADYRAYFESQSWYYPVEGRNASNFDASMLNDYEVKNIDTIIAYEKQMGWR